MVYLLVQGTIASRLHDMLSAQPVFHRNLVADGLMWLPLDCFPPRWCGRPMLSALFKGMLTDAMLCLRGLSKKLLAASSGPGILHADVWPHGINQRRQDPEEHIHRHAVTQHTAQGNWMLSVISVDHRRKQLLCPANLHESGASHTLLPIHGGCLRACRRHGKWGVALRDPCLALETCSSSIQSLLCIRKVSRRRATCRTHSAAAAGKRWSILGHSSDVTEPQGFTHAAAADLGHLACHVGSDPPDAAPRPILGEAHVQGVEARPPHMVTFPSQCL